MLDMASEVLIRPLSDVAADHALSPFSAMPYTTLVHGRGRPARRVALRRLSQALKRTLDVVGAGLGLVMLSPVLLGAAIAIRLESPGPVLFRQERWGQDMTRFRVFKFRSMRAGECDPSGVAQTTWNDRRLTRVGAFLRRSSIDELPQLINVLRGEMSLVGPRCHVPGMRAAGMAYEELVPDYHLRHTVRPGITGLAQVRGLRGPTNDRRLSILRIEFDFEYIMRANVLLDIGILARTCWQELRHGGLGF